MAVDPATIKAIITAAQKVISDKQVRNIVIGAVVAPLIIILMILSSPLAIFFAVIGDGSASGNVPAVTVIADLKNQLSLKVEKELKAEEDVDEIYLIVNGKKDGNIIDNSNQVLALFAVDQNMNPENASQVAILNKKQIRKLREVYWDMNTITSEIETSEEIVTTQVTDKNGKSAAKTSIVKIRIKNVYVKNYTWEEIVGKFKFNSKQLKVLEQMLDFSP